MRVAIIGYPRTGTTRLYNVFARLADSNSHLLLFEPFNPEPHIACRRYGCVHDIEGSVPCNTCSKCKALARLILENSKWLLHVIRNDSCVIPLLGLYAEDIVEQILQHKYFVVKDVCLWLRPSLVEKLLRENVHVVLTLRDFESLYSAFSQWYRKYCTLCARAKHIVCGILKRDVKKVLIGLRGNPKCCRRWLLGPGVFYLVLRGREARSLREALEYTYRFYVGVCRRLAERFPNITILRYKGLITRRLLIELVKRLVT